MNLDHVDAHFANSYTFECSCPLLCTLHTHVRMRPTVCTHGIRCVFVAMHMVHIVNTFELSQLDIEVHQSRFHLSPYLSCWSNQTYKAFGESGAGLPYLPKCVAHIRLSENWIDLNLFDVSEPEERSTGTALAKKLNKYRIHRRHVRETEVWYCTPKWSVQYLLTCCAPSWVYWANSLTSRERVEC